MFQRTLALYLKHELPVFKTSVRTDADVCAITRSNYGYYKLHISCRFRQLEGCQENTV